MHFCVPVRDWLDMAKPGSWIGSEHSRRIAVSKPSDYTNELVPPHTSRDVLRHGPTGPRPRASATIGDSSRS
ncbi:hypothetical protein TNCV_632751 [Trichonephila clavipes]|nr:hypothetical protein TNCV_632751 [Trichonephila clavipes]